MGLVDHTEQTHRFAMELYIDNEGTDLNASVIEGPLQTSRNTNEQVYPPKKAHPC